VDGGGGGGDPLEEGSLGGISATGAGGIGDFWEVDMFIPLLRLFTADEIGLLHEPAPRGIEQIPLAAKHLRAIGICLDKSKFRMGGNDGQVVLRERKQFEFIAGVRGFMVRQTTERLPRPLKRQQRFEVRPATVSTSNDKQPILEAVERTRGEIGCRGHEVPANGRLEDLGHTVRNDALVGMQNQAENEGVLGREGVI
jgi:hypothetical protein